MEHYDLNIMYGLHYVTITLQFGEYTGKIYNRIRSNMKGFDIINSCNFEEFDGKEDNDCNLHFDGEDYFKVTLKDQEGNKLEYECDSNGMNQLIVAVEITKFEE